MLEERHDAQRLVYRRSLRLRAEPGRGCAETEDNPRHFPLRLAQDGNRLRGIEAESPRYPWTTCPRAAEPLQRLAEMEISLCCTAIASLAEARLQCTPHAGVRRHACFMSGAETALRIHGSVRDFSDESEMATRQQPEDE